MYSHFWFDAPAARLATYYSKKAPVFLYSFDHVSENFYDYDSEFFGFVFLSVYFPFTHFLKKVFEHINMQKCNLFFIFDLFQMN